jgi:hypothetical protein
MPSIDVARTMSDQYSAAISALRRDDERDGTPARDRVDHDRRQA